MVNKQTKLYENTVVKKNLNVSEKLDVLGTLKLPNLSNTRELIIKENCHIYKSLDITRTVAWNEDFYPILNIDTNNENVFFATMSSNIGASNIVSLLPSPLSLPPIGIFKLLIASPNGCPG